MTSRLEALIDNAMQWNAAYPAFFQNNLNRNLFFTLLYMFLAYQLRTWILQMNHEFQCPYTEEYRHTLNAIRTFIFLATEEMPNSNLFTWQNYKQYNLKIYLKLTDIIMLSTNGSKMLHRATNRVSWHHMGTKTGIGNDPIRAIETQVPTNNSTPIMGHQKYL